MLFTVLLNLFLHYILWIFQVVKMIGGGANDMFAPPPHISTLFLSVHLGVLPPQYQKAGYASGYIWKRDLHFTYILLKRTLYSEKDMDSFNAEYF